ALVPVALTCARRMIAVSKRILPSAVVAQAVAVVFAAITLLPPMAAVTLSALAPLVLFGISKLMIKDITGMTVGSD
ncbi:MAG: hypothetical protein MI923_17890, partial [Phycisphaerales bacterium]|nr:hypothetical protein [Phycisphaerales bacterium]